MKMNKKIVIALVIIAAFMMLAVPLAVASVDTEDASAATPGNPSAGFVGLGELDLNTTVHGLSDASSKTATNVDLKNQLTVTVSKGASESYLTYTITGTLSTLKNQSGDAFDVINSWSSGSTSTDTYVIILGSSTLTPFAFSTSGTEAPTIDPNQDSKIVFPTSADGINGTYYMWEGSTPAVVAKVVMNLSAFTTTPNDSGSVTYVMSQDLDLNGKTVGSSANKIAFANVKAGADVKFALASDALMVEGAFVKTADTGATMATTGSVKLSNALTIGEKITFSGDLDLNSKTVTNNGTISVATVGQLTKAVGIGGNVSLTADISPTSPINIASGKTVTLDLGGKTIASSSTGKALNNFGTLTLQNGTISGPDTSYSVVKNFAGATLTINDLTVTGNPDTSGYIAVKQDDQVSEGGAVGTGGSITINSGTFTAGQAVQAWGTVIINGGTFNGRVTAWGYPGDNAGEVTINGGTFNAPIETYTWYSGSAAPTNTPNITINGGNFGSSSISLIHRNQGTIAAPTTPMYIFVKSGVSISSAASCYIPGNTGAKYYATLQDALAVATSGETIDLLSDVTVESNESFTVISGVTLSVPATLTLSVVGTLNVSGTLNNLGTVDVSGILKDAFVADATAKQIDNKGQINVLSNGQLKVGYQPAAAGINIDGKINFATGGEFLNKVGDTAVNTLIAGTDALIMMTAGTVTIDAKAVGGAVTYTLQKDAKATFAQSNVAGFAFKAGDVIDIDGELAIATSITIPEGAKLNVNGKVTGGATSVITLDKTATLDIGSSATVSVGKIDMTDSNPGVKAVMIKTGGVITALFDGSTTEAESKANLENIVAGNGGITIIRGSVYINGTIATPDATGKITVPAGAVKISGNVEEGVTLEVPAGSSVVIPKDSTLTFEEGSKFNYDNGATITFEEKSSSIIYEKGSEVNDVVIEVETKEDSEGTTVAVHIYLVSENEKKLIISVDYVEVLPGKTYGDALNGVIVTPTKKSVTFEGWYNLAFNEKIRSTDIVGNNDVTLTACFSDEGRVPVQKEDTPSETIIIDGTTDSQSFAGSDFALPVAIICLIVAILALGFVVLKKR